MESLAARNCITPNRIRQRTPARQRTHSQGFAASASSQNDVNRRNSTAAGGAYPRLRRVRRRVSYRAIERTRLDRRSI